VNIADQIEADVMASLTAVPSPDGESSEARDRRQARNRRKRARKAFQKKLEREAKPLHPWAHPRRRARKQAALLRQAHIRRKGMGKGSRAMTRNRHVFKRKVVAG
jgi:hypothetical protein